MFTPCERAGAVQEHCLMGLRGNVKRNADGHFIHANVDTDVIVSPVTVLAFCVNGLGCRVRLATNPTAGV